MTDLSSALLLWNPCARESNTLLEGHQVHTFSFHQAITFPAVDSLYLLLCMASISIDFGSVQFFAAAVVSL